MIVAVLAGCAPRLTEPVVLASAAPEPQLWAVAPFMNESGVSTVDTYQVADAFFQELQQVGGIDAVPVNRVLQAMRATDIASIGTLDEIAQLIEVLDIDALVVGTITTWDPYPPPTLGMAVQVFTLSGRGRAQLDPQELVRSASGGVAMAEIGPLEAEAQAAGVFDAMNHRTLAWLEQYAAGRIEPDSAFGTEIYLMDMTLYTQFVSYRLINDLLAFQQSRVSRREIHQQR